MANKYVISLEVDKGGAVTNIDKVKQQLDGATTSAANLKQQLREMQKQLSTLDANSDEFKKLSAEAGNLKDKIQDASKAVSAQAGTSFERLTNNSRNLKDALVNLDFEQVGSSLKGLAGTVGNIKFSEVTDGLKNVTKGFVSLGKALLTNPLFLIITGITLLVANFDKLTDALDGVTDAQIAAQEAAQATADASKAQYDNISAIENSLRVQGKSEEEILKLKKDQLNVAINQQKIAIQSAETILKTQVEAAERNKDIVKGILDFITAPIKVLLESIDSIGSTFGKDFGLAKAFEGFKDGAASLIFDPKEVAAEGQKTIDEARKQLQALENTRDGFILEERKKSAALAKEREDKRIEEAKQARQLAEELFKIQQEIQKKIAADQEKNSPLTKLISENDEKYRILKEQADIEFQLMKEGQDKEIAAIDAKYIALREKAAGNAELLLQLAKANQDEVTAVEQRSADERIKNEQAVATAKISLAANSFGALGDLASSFQAKSTAQAKTQFNIVKALNIAQALANTYLGASSAYAQTIGGPIIKGFAAATATLAGLANVNRIRQTTFSGGGGGSAGGGGGSASVSSSSVGGAQGAPQFNPVNTDFIQTQPPQPTPAYVLTGAVTSGQEAEQKIADQARL